MREVPLYNKHHRQSCSCPADEKPDEKWMVFDGLVDTLWIESMNSVLDDNEVLTDEYQTVWITIKWAEQFKTVRTALKWASGYNDP